MADQHKLINSRDAVYALNGYLALNGLQRFGYRYTGRKQDHDEIGNALHTDTSIEPETSGSFEVTDTGTLAALLARMRYNYDTQDYLAGNNPDIASNIFTITEDDLQYMIFDMVEQKKPGGTFTEAKLFPNCYLNRFGIRLTADNTGTCSFEWMGDLMRPIYKPYHKASSVTATYTSATQATIAAGWGVDTVTHGILGGMVNNIELGPADLAKVVGAGSEKKVDLTASGIAKVGALEADDRIMIWVYALTPGSPLAIDYVNPIRFVKPHRINLWLMPAATAVTDTNRMLKIQSMDVSVDIQRDELKEIARNESKTSTFFRHARYPLPITGSVSVLENTLHKWAELQGKTVNETAVNTAVDVNNVLDNVNFGDAKLVAKWYKYGSSTPIQTMTLGKVKILGYEGSMSVNGRKEATWSLESDGDLSIEGAD